MKAYERFQVAFNIMAFTRVASRDQYSISPFAEGFKDKPGLNSPGAQDPYNPEAGGVMYPGCACKVCGPVRAPVSQKPYDYRLMFQDFPPLTAVEDSLLSCFTSSSIPSISAIIWSEVKWPAVIV